MEYHITRTIYCSSARAPLLDRAVPDVFTIGRDFRVFSVRFKSDLHFGVNFRATRVSAFSRCSCGQISRYALENSMENGVFELK